MPPRRCLRWTCVYGLVSMQSEAPVKLCYHCRTELAMLEVSGSWLFHVAMNILWERKYLVSDSFYSAATHRLVTFQKSPKSNCCLSVSPSFTETRRCPALLRCAHALVVNGSLTKFVGSNFQANECPGQGELAARQAGPPLLAPVGWQHAPGCLCTCRQACFAERPVAMGGHGPTFPKSTLILILKSSRGA